MKKQRAQPKPNIDKRQKGNVFISVNSPSWRQPSNIDIDALSDLLNINVSAVEFEDQDCSINRPPDTFPIDTNLKLAADKNFLYVWTKDRWKRIPLSEF